MPILLEFRFKMESLESLESLEFLGSLKSLAKFLIPNS